MHNTYDTVFYDVYYENKKTYERLKITMRLDNEKFSTEDVRRKLGMSWSNEVKYVISRNKLIDEITLCCEKLWEYNFRTFMGIEASTSRIISSPMDLLADIKEIHEHYAADINAWYIKNQNMNMELVIEYGGTCDAVCEAFENNGFVCTRKEDTVHENDATSVIRFTFIHPVFMFDPSFRVTVMPNNDYKMVIYCSNDCSQELMAKQMKGMYYESEQLIRYDNYIKFKTYEDGMTFLKAIPKVLRKIGESMQVLKNLTNPAQFGATVE